MIVINIHAQNAPISTIGEFAGTDVNVVVPVTAIGINDIGSCNLQFLYDPAVATCVSVSKGPQLPGTIAYNIDVPGIITLGWYTWPGTTLTDNSVIFELGFTKVCSGASALAWDVSYTDRQWSDGSSVVLNDLPFGEFYLNGSLAFLENSPVTTAPVISSCSGGSIDVPITVSAFNSIGAISLTLQFNDASLTYDSFTNDSGFPGLYVYNPNSGVITAAGFSVDSGVSLPDGAVLFTLHFNSVSGSTALEWFDDGISCEYAGPPPDYSVLNDIPQESYYIDGFITELVAPTISEQPVSPDTVIAGSGIASFVVLASGSNLQYQWQEFITSWSDITNGEFYEGAFTQNLNVINPPLSMNGNKYRCIVTGDCDPEAISDGLATLTVVESTGLKLYGVPYSENKLELLASPNPFTNNITFEYFLPYSGHVIIEIVDTQGRNSELLSDQFEEAGNHVKKIVVPHLTPAYYLVKIQLNSNSERMEGLVKVVCIE